MTSSYMNAEDLRDLCMGCLAERGGQIICRTCGWREGAMPASPLYLTPRTILNEQYLVGRVLGHGGFGITYLGRDLSLGVRVAVKEFFPGLVATRHQGSPQVTSYSNQARSHYEYSLEKFIEEARALARFQDHPNVVTVVNFFHANGTAYIVMKYLEGKTFKEYLVEAGGKIPYELACRILIPVMDALRELHGAGLLHRDISPDNIYLTTSRQVKLLDFGAARYAMGEHSQNLSLILKPGYAPEEQYRSGGKQGPWTDVYALGATFYLAITGQMPPQALDRLETDVLPRPSELGVEIPTKGEDALMKALAVRAANRFQDVLSFFQEIASGPIGAQEKSEPTDLEAKLNEKQMQQEKAASRQKRWKIAAGILFLVFSISSIGWVYTSLRASDLREDNYQLRNKVLSFNEEMMSLSSAHPERQLSLAKVRITKDTSGFFSYQLNISAQVENNWGELKNLAGTLVVKIYNPDGSLNTTRDIEINTSDSTTITENFLVYRTGTYGIEVWWAGRQIRNFSYVI
jgi:serine/threonine protein kinase